MTEPAPREVDDLPLELRQEFRDAVQTLSDARRADAWETLFKAVRWALVSRGSPTPAMIAAAQRVVDECGQGTSGHGAPSLGAIEALRAALTTREEQ